MTPEIKPLTGFRGVAALVVVIYHFGQPPGQTDIAPVFHVPKGYLAVDAFFMLSGFVLSYSHQGFATPPSLHGWLGFMARRWARLYPVYYAVLLLVICKLDLSGDKAWAAGLSAWDWVGNLAMATGWGVSFKELVGISWSASAEMACYLGFPFVYRQLSHSAAPQLTIWAAVAIAGLCAYALNVRGINGPLDLPEAGGGAFPLLRAGCGFTLGCIVFQIRRRGGAWLEPNADAMMFAALGAIALGIAGNVEGLVYGALAVLILGSALPGATADRLFANRVAMELGRISYPLYLVHLLFINSILRTVARHTHGEPSVAIFIATLGACLVSALSASVLLHRLVERPALSLLGRRSTMAGFGSGQVDPHTITRRG